MNTLIILCAKYLFLVIVAISLYLGAKRPAAERNRYLLVLAISAVLALAVMKVTNHLISDPRPFVVGHFTPLIAHSADNGFPSDHTAISALFAFLLWPVSRRWSAILFGLAVVVGTSRVAAGVHHPLDIMGSIIITLAATAAGYYLADKFLSRKQVTAHTSESK